MKKTGFTLIEVIVTVAVILIIGLVAFPIIQKNIEESLKEEILRDIKLVVVAIEMEIDDNGTTKGEVNKLNFKSSENYSGNWIKSTIDNNIKICGFSNGELTVMNCLDVNNLDYSNNNNNIYIEKTKAYISDRIIRHYDGINNTGFGHDESVTKWNNLVDLENKTNGTLTNGPIWGNKGIKMDGINDYIYIPLLKTFDNKVTFEICFYNVYNNSSHFQTVVSADYDRIIIYNDDRAYMNGVNSVGTNVEAYASPLNFPYADYNKMHTYSVVYDIPNNKAIYYADGVLKKSYALPVGVVNFPFNLLRIFASSNGYYRKGIVYSVRVYDKVLTTEEVSHNYNIDKERFSN